MSNIIIRAYQKTDREAIRTICCDYADRGKPVEGIFPDRTVAADLLTAYYTDYEPASSFVAVDNGKVVGYVQGCLDNRRYGLVMLWILGPKSLGKIIMRGFIFHKAFWHTLGGMLANWRRFLTWRKQSFHSHEAHVHIGVAEAVRGKHVGQRLVSAFLHYAQTRGATSVSASVHEKNTAACRFFEHLGFRLETSYPMLDFAHNRPYLANLYVHKIT